MNTPNHMEDNNVYENADHLYHRAIERIVAQHIKLNNIGVTGDWVNIPILLEKTGYVALLKDNLTYPTLYRGDVISMIEITNPNEQSIVVYFKKDQQTLTKYFIDKTVTLPLLDGPDFPIIISEVGKIYLYSPNSFQLRVYYKLIGRERRKKLQEKEYKYIMSDKIITVKKTGIIYKDTFSFYK